LRQIIADLESGTPAAIISDVTELRNQIASLLKSSQPREIVLEVVLRELLKHFHSETGTIHFLDPEEQLLHLAAHVGLPPQLLEIVKAVPVGKGIAGQVVAQNQSVTICNLQADTSGVARPGARQTGVGGALCVPIRAGGKITGTLGIGTLRQHEYTADEARALEEMGRNLGDFLKG
jgi:L-methionine (R)-S-oxide reductase